MDRQGQGSADAPVRILAIPGSLRRDSFSRRLLTALERRAPRDVELRLHPIGRIPPYNADVEAAGLPPPVASFKEAIAEADALLIATPEYNAGVPGVLKNAIDWASRPAFRSPLAGKLVALVGASPGRGGARRGLDHLRSVLESTRADPLRRQIAVAAVHEKVHGEEIVDASLAADLAELLAELRDEARARRAGREAEAAVAAG